jgi:hypothetical protein
VWLLHEPHGVISQKTAFFRDKDAHELYCHTEVWSSSMGLFQELSLYNIYSFPKCNNQRSLVHIRFSIPLFIHSCTFIHKDLP